MRGPGVFRSGLRSQVGPHASLPRWSSQESKVLISGLSGPLGTGTTTSRSPGTLADVEVPPNGCGMPRAQCVQTLGPIVWLIVPPFHESMRAEAFC